MKPFDIELAKAGHPVCTRDGRKARIICFDKWGVYPIIALVQKEGIEVCHFYKEDGNCAGGTDYDLMMASEKKTGWINIYPYQGKDRAAMTSCYAHKTQEEAKKSASWDCIATVPIEWEE